jgi:hypothetical protein
MRPWQLRLTSGGLSCLRTIVTSGGREFDSLGGLRMTVTTVPMVRLPILTLNRRDRSRLTTIDDPIGRLSHLLSATLRAKFHDADSRQTALGEPSANVHRQAQRGALREQMGQL